MSKDIREYLHYFINCVRYRYRYIDEPPGVWVVWSMLTPERYFRVMNDASIAEVQIELRKLDSVTEEELTGLLISMMPTDMEDKPEADEYDLEMFHNDGGNMVDSDVAVGANYTCRCYEGQIAIRQTGDIDLLGEDGEREKIINQTAAFRYLLSRGFWLFGNDWFDEGLIIDKATVK